MRRPIPILVLAASLRLAGAGAAAAPIEYTLDLPADRRLSYEVEFEVAFPGRVRLDARWSTGRVLVLRLDRPGKPALRRSGPPPQHLEIDVAAEEIVADAPWTLSISGLPAREAAQGHLRIELPDPPELVAEREEEQRAIERPAPPPSDPWMLPATPPEGLGRERLRLYETTEALRLHVVDPRTDDAYRWQAGLLRFLAERRDRHTAAGPLVQPSSSRLIERAVEAVRALDALREADNTPLEGPEPTDAVRLRAWSTVRDPRFEPVEADLDALMVALHAGEAPELDHELWLTNFLSCIIVCERHFEERARLGREPAATRDLVREQWDTVVAAADALGALAALR